DTVDPEPVGHRAEAALDVAVVGAEPREGDDVAVEQRAPGGGRAGVDVPAEDPVRAVLLEAGDGPPDRALGEVAVFDGVEPDAGVAGAVELDGALEGADGGLDDGAVAVRECGAVVGVVVADGGAGEPVGADPHEVVRAGRVVAVGDVATQVGPAAGRLIRAAVADELEPAVLKDAGGGLIDGGAGSRRGEHLGRAERGRCRPDGDADGPAGGRDHLPGREVEAIDHGDRSSLLVWSMARPTGRTGGRWSAGGHQREMVSPLAPWLIAVRAWARLPMTCPIVGLP